MSRTSKVRIALGLLKRPTYWPDVFRRARLNVGQALLPPQMGLGRDVAEHWAASMAVQNAESAFSLLGLPYVSGLRDTHPDHVTAGITAERECTEELGGGASADLIFRLCEAIQARFAVETGVAYGWSSLAILASLERRDGMLVSVDMPRLGLKNHGLTGLVVPEDLRPYWTWLREPDSTGVRKILKIASEIDFVHYDSDKSYYGRAQTYRRLWPYLRDGGLFMSDDIGDNTAFRDFSAEIGIQPVVLNAPGSGLSGERYVGIIRKHGLASSS